MWLRFSFLNAVTLSDYQPRISAPSAFRVDSVSRPPSPVNHPQTRKTLTETLSSVRNVPLPALPNPAGLPRADDGWTVDFLDRLAPFSYLTVDVEKLDKYPADALLKIWRCCGGKTA